MKKIYIIILGLILATLMLLMLDVFGSDSKSVRLLGIHSEALVIPTLVIALIFRIKIGRFIKGKASSSLLLIVVGLMIAASLLAVAESMTPPNVVYSITRLHPLRLIIAAIFSGLVFFINQSDGWWKKHQNAFILMIPFAFFYVLYLISLLPFNIFKEIVKEDKIIEYLQFFVLFIGSVMSVVLSWLIRNSKNRLLTAFFIASAIGFFFVAGDEISWGQRLLGIETPESIKAVNRQEETTFHNLHIIEWAVIYAYIALSFFGSFAYLLASPISKLSPLKRYLPNKHLIGYFILPLIFFAAQRFIKNGIWHSWSEVVELYLYAGLVLWVISTRPGMKTG
jgi:hypothetical protein